jgi:hypothetical protein
MTKRYSGIAGCLFGIVLPLLVVGVVSGTVVRHLVQVAPLVVAGIVLMRSSELGAYAAMPLFLFWLLIAGLIWLYLLGLSRIASGTYSTTEIACTFAMAIACLIGIRQSIKVGRSLSLRGRVGAMVIFGSFQVAAMAISFNPIIANR